MSVNTRTTFWARKQFYLDGAVAANEIQKIVWEGDSLAFATFGVSYLYHRPPMLVNLAVPGSTTADLVSRQAAFITELNSGSNVCGVVWGGPYNALGVGPQPNTVAAGNAAADAFFAYLDTVLAGAPNAKLIAMNMLRRGDAPAGYPQVAWAQCSARITADTPLHSRSTFGTCIEVGNMPGTPGDQRNYDIDFIHGYPPGYQWLTRNNVAPRLYAERF